MGDLNDEVSWSVPAVYHQGRHSDDYALPENGPDRRTGKGPPWERGELPDDAYLDGRIANLAVHALGELQDRPFFLAVGFWRPHLPFLAPDAYWRRYKPDALALPANLQPPLNVPQIALHDWRELRGYTGMPSSGPVSTADHLRLIHGYYAGISYLDAQLGKVLDELDRLGLSDRTIVVFWSDHGYHLGQQSLWCKTSNFELDARVPLIIAPPDFQHAGERTDALVELIDIYPTLCSLCDFAPPDQIEGTSLFPLLNDPTATVKAFAITQHPRPAYYRDQPDAMGYSLRSDRFRYTAWFDWTTRDVVARELYDHANDRDETVNLVGQAEFADTVQRMHATLLEAVTPLPGAE
jgi:iduronate 2-sulfatase